MPNSGTPRFTRSTTANADFHAGGSAPPSGEFVADDASAPPGDAVSAGSWALRRTGVKARRSSRTVMVSASVWIWPGSPGRRPHPVTSAAGGPSRRAGSSWCLVDLGDPGSALPSQASAAPARSHPLPMTGYAQNACGIGGLRRDMRRLRRHLTSRRHHCPDRQVHARSVAGPRQVRLNRSAETPSERPP